MFSIYITTCVSLFFISLLLIGMKEIMGWGKKGTFVYIAIPVTTIVTFFIFSLYTYPSLKYDEVYMDWGTIDEIRIIGGVSKYTEIKISTDKINITTRAGTFPNAYVGARIGKKYTVEGGSTTTLYCIDDRCYKHSMCEWNMGCWSRAIERFKD
jgi:hypothetical protein